MAKYWTNILAIWSHCSKRTTNRYLSLFLTHTVGMVRLLSLSLSLSLFTTHANSLSFSSRSTSSLSLFLLQPPSFFSMVHTRSDYLSPIPSLSLDSETIFLSLWMHARFLIHTAIMFIFLSHSLSLHPFCICCCCCCCCSTDSASVTVSTTSHHAAGPSRESEGGREIA